MKTKLFSILLLLPMLLAVTVKAQTIVSMGASSAYGSTNTLLSTSTTINKYSQTISIYTAAEIIANGGFAGDITSIFWDKGGTGEYTFGDATMEVYLKHIPATQTSWPTSPVPVWSTELAGAQQVFASTTYSIPTGTGFKQLVFTTPFAWNGTDNIAVFVNWYRPGTPTQDITWGRISTADANATRVGSSPITALFVNSNRPNAQFEIVPAVSCTGTPTAATITGPTANVCENASFTLNASGQSTGAGITYQWQSKPAGSTGTFTDIAGQTSPTLTATATQSTEYQFVTTCTGSSQSAVSNTITVTVDPLPVVTGLTETHTGLSYTFTPTGVQNATSTTYDYGDGNNGSSNTHTYAAGGNYTVTVTVSNPCGTATSTLNITAAPVACSGTPDPVTISSSVTTPSICENTNFTLTATGQSTGAGITYQWQSKPYNSLLNFADIQGATSATYTAPALASEEYRFVTTCTNSSQTDVSNVLTIVVDSLPRVTAITETHSGLDYTFGLTGDEHVVSTNWDYGDGNSGTSNMHTYAAAGNYTVTATLTNPCGTATVTMNITVTTSVEDVNGLAARVSVYPNPASDYITVSSTDVHLQQIRIVNSVGETVGKVEAEKNKTTYRINTSAFAAGVYYLHLQADEGVVTKAFTIVK